MAFSPEKNQVFQERVRNWMQNAMNSYVEARKLAAIYTHEAAGDDDFQDTEIATTAEIANGVGVMSRYMNCMALDDQDETITPENQSPKITPFLQ